jgi:hypothetical protein
VNPTVGNRRVTELRKSPEPLYDNTLDGWFGFGHEVTVTVGVIDAGSDRLAREVVFGLISGSVEG